MENNKFTYLIIWIKNLLEAQHCDWCISCPLDGSSAAAVVIFQRLQDCFQTEKEKNPKVQNEILNNFTTWWLS